MNRFESQLRTAGPVFAALIRNIPLQNGPPLPPDWLRVEMLERFQVLRQAGIEPGSNVLEVGSGGHAITTVPLAFEIGSAGRVIAGERSRWNHFKEVVSASGLAPRIQLLKCDARRLPLGNNSVALSLCVHGIRSLGDQENLVAIFREMFRVSSRVFLAESLPIAKTDAQRAHLAMYDLRHEVFEAAYGHLDDLPYLPLDSLSRLVEQAGGSVGKSLVLEIDLPHALAHFPRSLVESVPNANSRQDLLRRWDEADSQGQRHGTDHPPVGIVEATRR
jgi:hypothetical protein